MAKIAHAMLLLVLLNVTRAENVLLANFEPFRVNPEVNNTKNKNTPVNSRNYVFYWVSFKWGSAYAQTRL